MSVLVKRLHSTYIKIQIFISEKKNLKTLSKCVVRDVIFNFY